MGVSGYAALGGRPYDPLAGGGATMLVTDTQTREVLRSCVSLT